MRKQTLSLAMIVKNEEAMLPACLESAQGIVDEIVVVDTGSTDATRDIAKEYGARIYEHPWNNNFAEARNVALQHCTGDWILQLDADERLVQWSRKALEEFLHDEQCGGYAIMIESTFGANKGIVVSPAVRLFRRNPAILYEGAIHESTVQSLQRLGMKIEFLPYRIVHYGYDDEQQHRQKAERNVSLMSEYLSHNPNDITMLLHYAMGLTTLKQYGTARNVLERMLSQDDIQPSAFVLACNLLAQGAIEQRDYHRAVEFTTKSLRVVPAQAYARKLRALALMYLGKYGDAERELLAIKEMILRREQHQQCSSLYDAFPAYSEVLEFIGACVAEQGRYEQAINYFIEAIDAGSLSPSVFKNIQNILPLLPDTDKYEAFVANKVEGGLWTTQFHILLWIELLCARGKYEVAEHVANQYAIPHRYVLETEIRWMMKHGHHSTIEEILKRIEL